MARSSLPDPRWRGPRRQVNTRQPLALAQAAEAEAARRDMSLTDYIGHLLADDLGMNYDTHEEVSLTRTA